MSLAVIGDEVSQRWSVAVSFAVQHGLDGVEARSIWGRGPLELTRAQCVRARRQVEEAGLRIPAFASPAFKSPLPERLADRNQARSDFERSLERARWLGADHVRVFSFYRPVDGRPALARAGDELADIVGPVDFGGLSVIVENGTRSNTPSARLLAALLTRLRGLSMGALWDPGNGLFSGFDPKPFPSGYRRLRPFIRHVHVKDPIGRLRYTRLGDGDVPWPTLIDALLADEYAGAFSLETHWRYDRDLTPELRDTPHGEKFSSGAIGPSSECARILRTMIRSRPR